jgi:uncharacterized membrane protein (DUF485 family)
MPPTRRRRISTVTYEAAYSSPEFIELSRRFRAFVLPVTTSFLAWYLLYVGLAAFAPGFMGTQVVGYINVGIVMGLLQFVSTFAITTVYWRWARRHLDPLAARVRKNIDEAGQSR